MNQPITIRIQRKRSSSRINADTITALTLAAQLATAIILISHVIL